MKISTKRNYKKEPEILELSNTISELKTSLEEISNLFDQAEERSSDLKDWSFEISQRNKKKMKKSEESLRDLQDTSSRTMYTLWKSK